MLDHRAPAPDGVPDAPPTVRLDYPNADIHLLATTDLERDVRAKACRKEPWTVEWIEASLTGGGVFYDIGANVGAFSLIAARQPTPPAVFAFEPGYRNFSHLCDNVLANGCAEYVTPVPLALAAHNGLGRFRYRSLEAGQSRHRLFGTGERWRGAMQQVPVLTLDTLVSVLGLPAPTHIKIDVDGAETDLLRGAPATLAAPTLRSVLLEVEDSQEAGVLALLERAGLRMRARHQRKPTAPAYVIADRA
jgi:FkbM family methyltransferase